MSVNGRAYTPPPGSTPGRALAFLQSQPTRDAELSTSALAEGSGVPAGGFVGAMQPALKAGLVFARQKGGHVKSPLFWSLVDHEAKEARTGEVSSPASGSQAPDGAAAIPRVRAGSETPQKGANRDASTGQSHGAAGSASPNGRGARGASARGAAPGFHAPGSRGTAASTGDFDDDEGDSGRARRLAGRGDDGGSRADRGRGIRARHGIEDHGSAANGAGLLCAQQPRAAHQGTAAEHDDRAAGDLIPEGRDSQLVLKAEAARPDATDREIPANASPVGGPMGARQSAAADPAGDAGAPLVGRTATLSMTGEVAVVAECGTVILFDAQRGRQLVTWLAGRAG